MAHKATQEVTIKELSARAKAIYEKYRNWRYGPSDRGYLMRELRTLAREHEDELLELIFSGLPAESELVELIHLGGDGGSIAKRHNEYWSDFVAKVRKRKAELPPMIQSSLDWLLRTHGW